MRDLALLIAALLGVVSGGGRPIDMHESVDASRSDGPSRLSPQMKPLPSCRSEPVLELLDVDWRNRRGSLIARATSPGLMRGETRFEEDRAR